MSYIPSWCTCTNAHTHRLSTAWCQALLCGLPAPLCRTFPAGAPAQTRTHTDSVQHGVKHYCVAAPLCRTFPANAPAQTHAQTQYNMVSSTTVWPACSSVSYMPSWCTCTNAHTHAPTYTHRLSTIWCQALLCGLPAPPCCTCPAGVPAFTHISSLLRFQAKPPTASNSILQGNE